MAQLALEKPHQSGYICPLCEGPIEWRMPDAKVIPGPVKNRTATVNVAFGRAQIRCDCDWRDLSDA